MYISPQWLENSVAKGYSKRASYPGVLPHSFDVLYKSTLLRYRLVPTVATPKFLSIHIFRRSSLVGINVVILSVRLGMWLSVLRWLSMIVAMYHDLHHG